jgi:hypothetical protein
MPAVYYGEDQWVGIGILGNGIVAVKRDQRNDPEESGTKEGTGNHSENQGLPFYMAFW